MRAQLYFLQVSKRGANWNMKVSKHEKWNIFIGGVWWQALNYPYIPFLSSIPSLS